MTYPQHPGRRRALRSIAALALAGAAPSWAQPSKTTSSSRALVISQIVDMSTSQIDVSKDFLVGARTAWQEFNSRGGIQGMQVKHNVLEVDGTAANLRTAVDNLKGDTQCVALFGSAGDRAASQLVGLLSREIPDLPHVAPWLQNVESVSSANTFTIFASRLEQISHAIKSLSVVGISQVGAVYGSVAEYAAYRKDLEQIGNALNLSVVSFSPAGDLKDTARQLKADSPRVLLFVGGTPELVRFAQGVEKQAMQRYIVAMSDVNLQSIQQMGQVSRFTPLIATQVVPMVNSSVAIVRSFKAALSRFYDEPPTPLSLAGYVAARYTGEVLQGIDGPVTRANALHAFSRRNPVDLGGLRIAPDGRTRTAAFVTQSMITVDGRLLG